MTANNEWKHSRVAWAPPCSPTESWWRLADSLTLKVQPDDYSDENGVPVPMGITSYDARSTVRLPERQRVRALEWCVSDSPKGTWPCRGRVLVRDYPSMTEALAAAKAQCEAAAAAYAAREVA